ncbi:MAG TPA: FtsX-like permease family protein, partial [Gemmatimonadales bacterium]|nr:FtsX-like permease family protein [Gemmatimonadales bacterium]
VNDLPLAGLGGISITVQAGGRSTDASGEPLFARYLQASGGYFPALGIPLVRGRLFTAADDTLAPAVAIVNQTMARTLWPGRDPIGQVFGWPPRPGARNAEFTVVGVVGDIRDHSLDAEPTMQMYFPVHAMTPGNVALVARGSLPPAQLLAALRQAVREADPRQAVYDVRMMDDVVSASVAPRRTNTLLISAFGGLALLLAVLGVYGVVAYSVVRRAREFGIRVALGATGAQLLSAVVGEMVWVTLLGLAAGLAGAWAASRVLQSLVYAVSARDPTTFLVAPAVLLLPVAVAILLPARRSLAVNPMAVMREE